MGPNTLCLTFRLSQKHVSLKHHVSFFSFQVATPRKVAKAKREKVKEEESDDQQSLGDDVPYDPAAEEDEEVDASEWGEEPDEDDKEEPEEESPGEASDGADDDENSAEKESDASAGPPRSRASKLKGERTPSPSMPRRGRGRGGAGVRNVKYTKRGAKASSSNQRVKSKFAGAKETSKSFWKCLLCLRKSKDFANKTHVPLEIARADSAELWFENSIPNVLWFLPWGRSSDLRRPHSCQNHG